MIGSILDPYDRKARLYPALLVMLVPVISATLVAPVFSSQLAGLASLTIALGGLMLLSSLGREWGKRKEPKLFESWGGTPTTLMLLRATSQLDHLTLDRYRKVLEEKVPGLQFPDSASEASDPANTAVICESAVKWLREATRDTKKFALVFAENTNYGFRRNLLGVKPLALVMCVLTLAATALHAWQSTAGNLFAVTAQSWSSEVVACIGLVVWGAVVNADFVKTTAFAYATALLAACDSPLIATVQTKSRKTSATNKS
ncbi:MAG: hypothetical protein HY847_19875 [Betaproteobacteria bacterium]|nr:hypothetical protein [Betaproteobacteria bacterium]